MHAPKYRRPSGEQTMSTMAFLRHKWMHFDSAHKAIRKWLVSSFLAMTWRTTYVPMHNWIRFDRAIDESTKPNFAVHPRKFIAYLSFAWIELHPEFVQIQMLWKENTLEFHWDWVVNVWIAWILQIINLIQPFVCPRCRYILSVFMS